MIRLNRNAITNWWDAYNGYSISDFWHEFSRSKLHIRGQAISVILPHDTTWYRLNGGAQKANKDIYDILIAMEIDWLFYDKWSITSQGNFEYERDERVDMIYMVYRSQARFVFENDRFWGYANLGGCEGATNNEYLVYESGETQVRIRGDGNGVGGNLDSLGSGVVLWGGSSSTKSRQRVIDVVTHEHGHYFFGSDHKIYGKMADGPSSTSEFSLSPWEMVKLAYVEQQFVNYSNPNYYLLDYMSRSGTAGTQGEIRKYKVYCDTSINLNVVPPDAIQNSEVYYRHIATVNIPSNSIPEYIDSFKISSCYSNSVFGDYKYPVRYRVQAIDSLNTASVLSDFAKTEAWVLIGGAIGPDNFSINENVNIPKEYSLKQNYPNPFNPITNIQYDLPFDNFVSIKVYDLLGKEVMTLINEFKQAGSYFISFNGNNLSSGIYYYKIKAGSFEAVRKMILIK